MSLLSKRGRRSCIGDCQRNGLRFYTNGYASQPHTLSATITQPRQATSTAQLNTILTFYEIIEPPVPSPLSGIPATLLRRAVNILTKTNRAQVIAVADGEGVRFLPGNPAK